MTSITDRDRLVDVSWRTVTRLVHLARRAGHAILAHGRQAPEIKGDGSPVTSADRLAQDIICEELAAWDPSVPIVSEEAPLPDPTTGEAWCRYWLVDPLDGTKEFVAGRHDFTVNIALIEEGEPVLGVVGAPALDTMYWAARGLGSWRQQRAGPIVRLRVRAPDPAAGGRIVESRSHPSPALEAWVAERRVTERVQVGSSLKFCWIAEGRADCYPRLGRTMAWDVAAGDCVFRHAAPGLTPHPSPLTYRAGDFAQPSFVIGFVPARSDAAAEASTTAAVDAEPPPLVDAPEGLIVHRSDPLNAQSPLMRLSDGEVTPTNAFFIRSHFRIPDIAPATFRLRVGGMVERSLELGLDALKQMPRRRRRFTLECAGNGRTLMVPAVSGEPWSLGAVGNAEWGGVPLASVLACAGIRPGAREVVFRGADTGSPAEGVPVMRFERSLRLDEARAEAVLLAYEMNGEPLTPAHGYPLRLVVPGWYGMAWVKWLSEIEVIDEPSTGFFQAERYWYEWMHDGVRLREPVTRQRVRSLILSPEADAHVPGSPLVIRGVAWSGAWPVRRVDVSIGDGPWRPARLAPSSGKFAWQHWDAILDVPDRGPVVLRARAMDSSGVVQPERAEWNRLGYGNHAVHRVPIHLT